MNITRREIIMAKHYDKEFKENALKYREDNPKLSVAAVCRNLGISFEHTTTGKDLLMRTMIKLSTVVQEISALMKQRKTQD